MIPGASFYREDWRYVSRGIEFTRSTSASNFATYAKGSDPPGLQCSDAEDSLIFFLHYARSTINFRQS